MLLLRLTILSNAYQPKNLDNQCPFEVLYGWSPDYIHLRPFRRLVYAWLRPHTHHKLQPQSTTCVFLGYHPTMKGYMCYDPVSQKIYVSCHVRFVEDKFPCSQLLASPSPSNPLGIILIFPPRPSSQGPALLSSKFVPSPTAPQTVDRQPHANTPD